MVYFVIWVGLLWIGDDGDGWLAGVCSYLEARIGPLHAEAEPLCLLGGVEPVR